MLKLQRFSQRKRQILLGLYKKLLRFKCENRLSFLEARRRLRESHKTETYSSAAASRTTSNSGLPCSSTRPNLAAILENIKITIQTMMQEMISAFRNQFQPLLVNVVPSEPSASKSGITPMISIPPDRFSCSFG